MPFAYEDLMSYVTLCFVQLLYFVYLCVTVFFFCFFLKSHRKSLSEPGVSCSTSMSLVCIAASLVFEQIKWWWWWWWWKCAGRILTNRSSTNLLITGVTNWRLWFDTLNDGHIEQLFWLSDSFAAVLCYATYAF